MEIKWRTVTGSQEQRPDVIDQTSSSKYVYLRRNIQRITRIEESGNPVTLWQYDEAVITHEEYAPYDTFVVALVQSEIDNLVTEQDKKIAEQNALITALQADVEYTAMMADIDLEG